jgi:hypothetical protein
MIYNVPTFIEFGTAGGRAVRFLIFDAPTDGNVLKYLEVEVHCNFYPLHLLITLIQFLKAYNVEHVIRTCSLTYSTLSFEAAGITIHV